MLPKDSHAPRTRGACMFLVGTACLTLWPVAHAAQPRPNQPTPQPPALTQRGEIPPYGIAVRYPADWSFSGDGGLWRLLNVPADRAATVAASAHDQLGQILITVERRRDHADAVYRLQSLRGGAGIRATVLTIGGWPAVQRRVVLDREQPGGEAGEAAEEAAKEAAEEAARQPPAQQPPTQQPPATGEFRLPPQKPLPGPARILHVTTAVAAGDLFVRLEGRLPPDAPAAVEATVRAIGQSLTFRATGNPIGVKRELARLQQAPLPRPMPPPPSRVQTFQPMRLGSRARPASPGITAGAGPAPLPRSLQMAGLAQRVIPGGVASETEIAVSTNGQNVVIAQQFRYATSNDGGQTFPFNGFFPNTTSGDPSLAFGRSGTFYAATINITFGPAGAILGGATAFSASTDNGQTFTARTNAFTCPPPGPGGCPANFPDQEHIAADRFNAATVGGGDQVYSVWRPLNGTYGMVCSNDGGQNWTAAIFPTGDLPRITVAPDGFVFVVYQNGNDIEITRYSSCSAGLTPQLGWPRVVTTLGPNWAGGSPCTMPGLDRCNDGNTLSSFTVAVDDTNSNHVYVAYAQNTSAANENVLVRHSTDSGFTWTPGAVVTVNGGGNGRRFMPWVCTAAGVAYVSLVRPAGRPRDQQQPHRFLRGQCLGERQRESRRGPRAENKRHGHGRQPVFRRAGGSRQRGELARRLTHDDRLGELLAATRAGGPVSAADRAATRLVHLVRLQSDGLPDGRNLRPLGRGRAEVRRLQRKCVRRGARLHGVAVGHAAAAGRDRGRGIESTCTLRRSWSRRRRSRFPARCASPTSASARPPRSLPTSAIPARTISTSIRSRPRIRSSPSSRHRRATP